VTFFDKFHISPDMPSLEVAPTTLRLQVLRICSF